MLAGDARFTVVSAKSGTRFTYRVRAADQEGRRPGGPSHFVSVLTGANNETDYGYLGLVREGAFEHGRKSRISASAPSARVFAWFWRAAETGANLDQCEVHHEGRCGRCGRALTVPASIVSGFGPECIQYV
jgi:hypothetical protein